VKRDPKIHKDLIIAWANGAPIQKLGVMNEWIDVDPEWYAQSKYRIKPTPKHDKKIMFRLDAHHTLGLRFIESTHENYAKEAQYIYVTFDGETAQIKNVEIAT
jgi:hypothetical protein